MRDIRASALEILAARDEIVALAPDAILLQRFDFDHEALALAAFSALLAEAEHPMPYHHAPRPNSGRPSGIDLDGDGRAGRYDDALGFGRFEGAGGMALLSRWPIEADSARDFTAFLWRDLPPSQPDLLPSPEAARLQPLSSTGHWEVTLRPRGTASLRLLASHSAPPLFGDVEGRNRARNHDETAFWHALLEGRLPFAPPAAPFLLLTTANQDPNAGESDARALTALLASGHLRDPRPSAADGSTHTNPPNAREPLRASYIFASFDVATTAQGLARPADPESHALLWIDIELPP